MTSGIPSFLHEIVKTGRDRWSMRRVEANAGNISQRTTVEPINANGSLFRGSEWTAVPAEVEFVPWMLPGSAQLAEATARALEKRRIAVWQFHGVRATGRNLDSTFGRIDTVEKAAAI
jgi:Class II Aldolase and Adducin N-terminal domain